jgi:hypothetical protein
MNLARSPKKASPKHIAIFALRFILIFSLVAIGSLAFLISPVLALSITSFPAPLPQGQVGIPYSATLTASGTAPYTWGAPIGLPTGLSLTPSGATATISGTPTSAGAFAFSITVQDASPATNTFTSTITITPPPFTITTSSLPQGKEGTSYTATLSASGGTAPYNWSISSGSLPSGLILQATSGYVSGIPDLGTYGSTSFTVNVTDSSSPQLSAQKSFSIYIEKGVYQATIAIGSGLGTGNTRVSVNGTPVTTLEGGESINISLALGATGNVSVDPIVEDPTDPGVRFKAEDESIVVSEAQPYATFTYYTEYLVTINTEPSLNIQGSGAGWYKKDGTINANINAEVEGNTGTLYRFASWLLPSGNKVTTETLNLTVDSPITVTAIYDTYYKLTTESVYGEVEGGGWYKAGSEARWVVINDKVPMPGLIGLFQGKYKAVNSSGTEVMDAPKTVTVFWEPDYLLPYILIPLTVLIVIAAIVGIYFLLRRQQPKPQPMPTAPFPLYPPYPPPRAIPQQHTTVVMIGDKGGEKQKQLPQTTKEQLMEKFGELLETYETEIKTSLGAGAKELPKAKAVPEEKMISAPEPSPQPVFDAEFTQEEVEEQKSCQYTAKKLIRTVTTAWRQAESDTITLPSTDKSNGETTDITGLFVVWARDVYHEWEIITCSRPLNHKGKHKGDTQVVYSLLNTVTEKKTYGSEQKLEPPTPHFTDGMPEVEISDDQIVLADELPSETIK